MTVAALVLALELALLLLWWMTHQRARELQHQLTVLTALVQQVAERVVTLDKELRGELPHDTDRRTT